MPTEVSKIEEIIKSELEEETKRSIGQLTERIADETKQAIDRINGVYGSAINTLKKLELADSTIFEFFEKTKGNIRVIEFINDFSGNLDVQTPGGTVNETLYRNPIRLKEKTKYKLIFMAIEVKDE